MRSCGLNGVDRRARLCVSRGPSWGLNWWPSWLRLAGTADWEKFTSPDGNFSILLPGAPETQEQEAVSDSQLPATTIHFVTAKSPTSTFFCNYWDLSYTPENEVSAQISMAGGRDGMIHEYDGHLVSHEESASGGQYTQTFKASMPDDGIMEGKFFIIGRRQYMLAVARPAEDSDEETRKFFNSFKLSSSSR